MHEHIKAVSRWAVLELFLIAAGLLFPLCASADVPMVNVPSRLEMPSPALPDLERGLLLDIGEAGARLVAVGEYGVIVYSEDRGSRWQQAEVPVSVLLTGVFFIDEQYGWAVGHRGVILHTQDGGRHWQKQLDGWQVDAMVLASAKDWMQQLQSAAEAGESTLDSVGEEPIEPDGDLLLDAESFLMDATQDAQIGADKPLLDIWFADRLHGFAVGAYGLLLETRDGGQNWSFIGHRLDNSSRFHLNAIAGSREGSLLIVGEAGTIFSSEDLGQSWQLISGDYEGSYFGARILPDQSYLVFGLRGHAFISRDQGEIWESLRTDTDATLMGSLLAPDGRLWLVGYGGAVLQGSLAERALHALPGAGFNASHAAVLLDPHTLLLAGNVGLQKLALR